MLVQELRDIAWVSAGDLSQGITSKDGNRISQDEAHHSDLTPWIRSQDHTPGGVDQQDCQRRLDRLIFSPEIIECLAGRGLGSLQAKTGAADQEMRNGILGNYRIHT